MQVLQFYSDEHRETSVDVFVAEPDDRRHRAAAGGNRGLHQLAALGHELNRVDQGNAAGANQGGVFAETVPRHHRSRGHFLTVIGDAPARDPGTKHRRLSNRGLVELLFGAFADHGPQIVTECVRGLTEYFVDLRLMLFPGTHHADRLRPLPGENIGKFCHGENRI